MSNFILGAVFGVAMDMIITSIIIKLYKNKTGKEIRL